MSSKGRGADVAESENYPTPAWCTRRILEALRNSLAGHYATHHTPEWLEPCAGEGAIVSAVRERFVAAYIETGDIRGGSDLDGSDRHIVMPFTGWEAHRDVVITNPPFSLAPDLIRHFLPRCDWLILLLRSAFRLSEWRHDMPNEYKLPQRPSFIASEKCKGRNAREGGCGWSRKGDVGGPAMRACPACGGKAQRSTSDSSEYSWFVWTPERGRSAGLTRVLPDTPLDERKATG